MANFHFIYTADWHIGDYRTGPDAGQTLGGRLLDIQNRIQEILIYAGMNKIGHIFIGGDIFRDRHPSMLHMTIFSEFLRDAMKAGIHVWAFTGNHDQARMQGQVHALNPFRPIVDSEKVTLIDMTMMVYPDLVRDMHWPFLIFPYIKSPQAESLKSFLEQVHQSQPELNFSESILMLHGAVEGAMLKNMVEYEIFDEDLIPFEMVMGFKGVFAGHLHECQNFNNVWYPGSIERLTFDDEGTTKFFLDVELGTNLKVFKVLLNARKMMTLKASQMDEVQSKDIDVEGAIVRVINADSNYVQDIKQVLMDNGVYHIPSIYTADIDLVDIPSSPSAFDIDGFVRRHAAKTDFKGDLPHAMTIIKQTLDGTI